MSIERGHQHGVTVIEIIMFMLIIGVAATGVMNMVSVASRSSSDPLVRKQALAIAESLMEEVRLMPFTYCDGDDPAVSTAVNLAACTIPETLPPGAAELAQGETRYSNVVPFDHVNDYNGFAMAAGVLDMTGAPVAGLDRYTANVTILPQTIGGIPLVANGGPQVLRITVTVVAPGGLNVRLDSYRTRYAPNSA